MSHKYTLPLVHTLNEYHENTKLILQKRAYSSLCANHSRAGLKPELLYAKTNQLSDMSENTSDTHYSHGKYEQYFTVSFLTVYQLV